MSFETFLEQRGRLADALAEVAAICGELDAAERARYLHEARETLGRDAFRIMVLGEFKRGKSTLINALLGRAVLPARVAPCTAVITELKWGEDARAVLHPIDGPPIHVPIERLRDHVVIGDDEDTPAPPAYRRIEVYYPLPLLHNNVEIVDSPGLNEHRLRNEIALDYLPRADAVVMVLSCEQQLSGSELAFIETHLPGPPRSDGRLRHVFFVWNRCDAIAPGDVEDVHARSRRHLEPRVVGARIFYVSARDALRDGRPESSGLPAFERALEMFLATERGRVKMLAPLRAAEHAVREALTQHIPRRLSLLAEPLDAIRRRHAEQQPRLAALKTQREALLRTVERRRAMLAREAAASYQNLVARLCVELPEVAAGIDVRLWDAIAGDRRLAEELQRWLEEQVAAWQVRELEPLCDRHLTELEADMNRRLAEFVKDLDGIRAALTPDVEVPAGSGIGVDVLLRGLGPHVALVVTLLIAGAGTTVIVAASAALGIARAVLDRDAAVARLRRRVTDEIGEGLRQGIPAVTDAMTTRLGARFTELAGALDASLRVMIDEVDAVVRAILDERIAGEVSLAEAVEQVEGLRRRLLAVAVRIDAVRAGQGDDG